jgi:hypothetical protein
MNEISNQNGGLFLSPSGTNFQDLVRRCVEKGPEILPDPEMARTTTEAAMLGELKLPPGTYAEAPAAVWSLWREDEH